MAHIDHSWRKESLSQALALKAEVENLGLPFHFCTLQDLTHTENAARETRYAFLEKVAKEMGAQAILLGHQMEDQAETVLKRVLEGASLSACRGMRQVSEREGIALWRPLLAAQKKDLVQWLDERGISYVQDETNLSDQFLRGRFRTMIFPPLEAAFGKSIVKNLWRLGERAEKLEHYLEKQVESLWSVVKDGSSICLSLVEGMDETILDYFLKRWTKERKIFLSLDQLAVLRRMVTTGNSQIQVQTSTHIIQIVGRKLALKKIYDYLEK